MRVIRGNDYQILERLIGLKQPQVKKTVSTFLKGKYPEVVETKDYILAEGDIPIALVAHLDTVFEKDKEKRDTLFYDTQKGVMWNPYGAGFDDRAGVFAILKIIKDGFKPHVIFTTNEESGGLGAIQLTEDISDNPFKDLKYIIELDRANEVDCVFYDCYNENFIDYVERFGFIEAWGTFSDIDIICPEWKVAGVNLSIGYKDEHSCSETLYVNAMMATIQKVKKMLEDAKNCEQFIYIPSPYMMRHYPRYFASYYGVDFDFDDYSLVKCDICNQYMNEYDSIPVKGKDNQTKHYCCDCIVDENSKGHIQWCRNCGEAFEIDKPDVYFCDDCRGVSNKWKKSKKKSKK